MFRIYLIAILKESFPLLIEGQGSQCVHPSPPSSLPPSFRLFISVLILLLFLLLLLGGGQGIEKEVLVEVV